MEVALVGNISGHRPQILVDWVQSLVQGEESHSMWLIDLRCMKAMSVKMVYGGVALNALHDATTEVLVFPSKCL